MKKILLVSLILTMLVGCGTPRTYGDAIDWSQYEDKDFHVTFATSRDGCYSDGSFMSNMLMRQWIKDGGSRW